MAKGDILLSKKFGVNPSMTVCFYCGEATGIALMGKLKGDVEAPKQICNSIEPCDKCKEKFKGYTLLVEKPSEDENPTGRWVAVKKEAITPEFREYPIMFMLPDEFENLINQKEA